MPWQSPSTYRTMVAFVVAHLGSGDKYEKRVKDFQKIVKSLLSQTGTPPAWRCFLLGNLNFGIENTSDETLFRQAMAGIQEDYIRLRNHDELKSALFYEPIIKQFEEAK